MAVLVTRETVPYCRRCLVLLTPSSYRHIFLKFEIEEIYAKHRTVTFITTDKRLVDHILAQITSINPDLCKVIVIPSNDDDEKLQAVIKQMPVKSISWHKENWGMEMSIPLKLRLILHTSRVVPLWYIIPVSVYCIYISTTWLSVILYT